MARLDYSYGHNWIVLKDNSVYTPLKRILQLLRIFQVKTIFNKSIGSELQVVIAQVIILMHYIMNWPQKSPARTKGLQRM